MGHADDIRLRHWLSQQFLQHGNGDSERRDCRRDIQGIQRHAGLMGLQSNHEPAVWADVAADIL
jgi:hypothetical protein